MNLAFLERVVLQYFEKHPEVIERLVEALIQKIVAQLEAHQPSQ